MLTDNEKKIKRAIDVAKKVQSEFYKALRKKGEEVLKNLGDKRGLI